MNPHFSQPLSRNKPISKYFVSQSILFPKYFLQILCSLLCMVTAVSVPLAQWLASGLRDFLKCQEPKRRNILFWSLQISCKLDSPFNAKPGIYSSVLTFTSSLHRCQRSAKGGSPQAYGIFWASSPWHACCTPDSLVYAVVLWNSHCPKNLSSYPPSSQTYTSVNYLLVCPPR